MAEPEPSAAPRPPRWLAVTAGLVVAFAAGMMVVGALVSGISVDENYHVVRLQNYLDDGQYRVPGEPLSADGEMAPASHVYAPVTTLLLNGLVVVAGQGDWGEVSTSTDAYAVRHVGIALIGILGLAATGAMARILLGSWRWGLIAAAVLASIPTWTGHSMFNLKDIPVATGFSLFSAGLMAVAAGSLRSRPAWQRHASAATLFSGTVLMLGTRSGMWPAVVLALGTTVVILARGRALRRAVIVSIAGAVLGAVALLVVIYPEIFAHPTAWWTAATASSDFGEVGAFGRAYIPVYVAVEYPILVLAALVGGLVGISREVLTRRLQDPVRDAQICIVLVQGLALAAAAIILDSPLYGGLRQVLFLIPATAVLATLGMAAMVRDSGLKRANGLTVGWVIVAAAVVLPTASQVTSFPYQYSSQNVAADVLKLPNGTDFWRLTFHEYIDDMPTNGIVICDPPVVVGLATPVREDGSVHDCRSDPISALSSEWRERKLPATNDLPEGSFYGMFITGAELPSNCHQLAAVTRWRNGHRIVLSRFGLCKAR